MECPYKYSIFSCSFHILSHSRHCLITFPLPTPRDNCFSSLSTLFLFLFPYFVFVSYKFTQPFPSFIYLLFITFPKQFLFTLPTFLTLPVFSVQFSSFLFHHLSTPWTFSLALDKLIQTHMFTSHNDTFIPITSTFLSTTVLSPSFTSTFFSIFHSLSLLLSTFISLLISPHTSPYNISLLISFRFILSPHLPPFLTHHTSPNILLPSLLLPHLFKP